MASTPMNKSVGGFNRRYPRASRTVLSDFLDHAGNPVVCVMTTSRPEGLPIPRHPYSVQVYLTNGLTYSPNPWPKPLPRANSDETSVGMTMVSPSDEPTTEARKFVTAFFESMLPGSRDKYYALAFYFMPKDCSAEDCMAHYQLEREDRAQSTWPMPASYAITKDFVDYRDVLLRVQPREDGSLVFGPGHPVQFVHSGKTKIIPPQLANGIPDDMEEEEKEALIPILEFEGVEGRTYPTVTNPSFPFISAYVALDSLVTGSLVWSEEDGDDWAGKEFDWMDNFWGWTPENRRTWRIDVEGAQGLRLMEEAGGTSSSK